MAVRVRCCSSRVVGDTSIWAVGSSMGVRTTESEEGQKRVSLRSAVTQKMVVSSTAAASSVSPTCAGALSWLVCQKR